MKAALRISAATSHSRRPGTAGPHGGHMHVHRAVHADLYLLHLFGRLVVAHVGHRHDEVHRRLRTPAGQHLLMLCTVGRQRVEALPLLLRGADIGFKFPAGSHVAHAHESAHLTLGGHIAHPHDVVDGQFVGEDDFPVGIDVDEGAHAGVVRPEVVEHRAVLTEGVAVVAVVHAHFPVADEDEQAAPHPLPELGSAFDICLFAEIFHNHEPLTINH